MPSSTKTSPRQRTAGRKRTGAAREKPKAPRVSPRKRKPIDPNSQNFRDRFALRLRKACDDRGVSTEELQQRCIAAGLPVSLDAVKKWLSGDRLPNLESVEIIATALTISDYRNELLPEPLNPKPKRRRR